MGQPGMRALTYAHCRDVTREFSRASSNAGRVGADSGGAAGVHDFENDICDLDGRIALHVGWIAVAFEEQQPGDGCDRRASAGDGGKYGGSPGGDYAVSRVAAAQ